MFLWVDPSDTQRALLWVSTPTESIFPEDPNLLVLDITEVPAGGGPRLLAQGTWNDRLVDATPPLAVHSMAPTADGETTYLAYLGGTVVVLNTSEIAHRMRANAVVSLDDELVTDPRLRPKWPTNPGAHSAVPVPGRPRVLVTDEVYGTYAGSGCPWGWVRLLDVRRPQQPRLIAEYKLPENEPSYCGVSLDKAENALASFASHNPTVLPELALVSWHSGGLQAIDLTDPPHLSAAGSFVPEPIPTVSTEDPALSNGPEKVVMWSYPIIKDGLVYVVDVRNGLYVLRYTGRHAGSIAAIGFLEGNSNVGDAVELAGGG